MSLSITPSKNVAKSNRTITLWYGMVGVLLMAGILWLAHALKQDDATQLPSVPWQTLLFIDHSTKNL